MFTIEHAFNSTVITLMDDKAADLREDVIISAFEDRVTVSQYDPGRNEDHKITLSLSQLRDLHAALDLPEGAYQLHPKRP